MRGTRLAAIALAPSRTGCEREAEAGDPQTLVVSPGPRVGSRDVRPLGVTDIAYAEIDME